MKKLADRLMHFPTWVDLKGQDSVPDTVHHVIVPVNPRQDSSWTNLKRSIQTDGVHAKDRVGAGIGKRSEAYAYKKYYYSISIWGKYWIKYYPSLAISRNFCKKNLMHTQCNMMHHDK